MPSAHRSPSSRITGGAKWKRRRAQALKRDHHQCQHHGLHCTEIAREVHHVVSAALIEAAGGDPYALDMLTSLCAECHAELTALDTLQRYARRVQQQRAPRDPAALDHLPPAS